MSGVRVIVIRSRSDVARLNVTRADVTTVDGAIDDFEILHRLWRAPEIEVVHDLTACVAACEEREIDLIVVDAGLGSACDGILARLRDLDSPVIVAGRGLDSARALTYFRAGAADCLILAPGRGEAFKIAAREHVERARVMRMRRRADRTHRNLEQYHENVIQNLNTALLVVDTSGVITASNPPAEQILDETPDGLRGKSVSCWFGGTAGGASLVARTLSDGSRFRAVESLITRLDGTRVPIGISWAPLFDSAGKKLGAVATFQDISGLKSLQTQVLQTEKMASIGQLAAGVAHEINNPMGFIHANLFQMSEYVTDLRRGWESVETLRKAVAHGAGDDVRRAADNLTDVMQEVDIDWVLSDLGKAIRESQEGSERIKHIVQDLRDFSHNDTGELVLVDVNQCLESTVRIVWPMMKHMIELERDYGDLPNVYGYPMQLKQVFMNLLVNAYQAVEEQVGNSGKLGRIWITTSARDDGVAVVVRDTGTGISSENIDRIFDPFFTTKKVGSGTGLGLSTSYSIVKRHSGTLEVESKPGEGSEFVLFLPSGEPEEGLEERVGFE